MSSVKEAKIEGYLVASVKEMGGECYKLEPPPKGIQDRLVLLPGGFIAFVELKRPKGGVTTKIQKYRAARTRFLGQKHYEISTFFGVDQLLQDWQNFIQGDKNGK